MNKSEIEAVRERFDRVAAEWDANPARVALAKGVAEAIGRAVPLRPDMRALDFGAGTGLLTLALAPLVGRITAVDASGEMVRVLEGEVKGAGFANVETVCCDIAKAPIPADAFDVVVSSMVLHHLPDVPLALRRLRPCVKRGGWIALADLDTEDGSFHADATGVFHQGFARDDVSRWLKEAGFADTAAGEAYRVTRTAPDGKIRVYPVFLATARAR